MKHLFISCLTLLLFTACSTSEDNVPVNQEPQGTGTGALKKIDEIWYADFNIPMRNVYEYSEEGKLLKASQYLHASATQPTYVRHYTYTPNGLLESYKVLDNGVETRGKKYTYDSQGRMKTLTYVNDGIDTSIVEFIYSANTITANSTSLSTGNEWTSKIFYLNNTGLIYKETEPADEGDIYDVVFEVEYDGSNVITFEDPWGTGSYTYDEEHDPALMNLNMGVGTQKNNAILRELSIFESEGLINTKYITSMSYNDGEDFNRTMEYTFSPEGLVLNKTTHENDVLERQAQYYYYQ